MCSRKKSFQLTSGRFLTCVRGGPILSLPLLLSWRHGLSLLRILPGFPTGFAPAPLRLPDHLHGGVVVPALLARPRVQAFRKRDTVHRKPEPLLTNAVREDIAAAPRCPHRCRRRDIFRPTRFLAVLQCADRGKDSLKPARAWNGKRRFPESRNSWRSWGG